MSTILPTRPAPDPGCSMCGTTAEDLAARQRLRATFEALATAERTGASVVRIADMHAVLTGRGRVGGPQR